MKRLQDLLDPPGGVVRTQENPRGDAPGSVGGAADEVSQRSRGGGYASGFVRLVALALVVLGALTALSPVLYMLLHPNDQRFGVVGGFVLYLTVPAGGVLAVAGLLVAIIPPVARIVDVSRTHSYGGAVGFYVVWLALSALAAVGTLAVSLSLGATAEVATCAAYGVSVLLSVGLALAALHAKRALASWPLLAIALSALPVALVTVTVGGLGPAAILTTTPARVRPTTPDPSASIPKQSGTSA